MLYVKLWFTTMFYVGFWSVLNLIVFCSIISLYVYEIWCKGWVWEFGEELWRQWSLRLAHKWTTCERSCEKHMQELEQSFAKLYFTSHFATQAKSIVTHETLYLKLFKVFFSHFFTNTISPYYPQNCKETFREKTLAIHLRVRDCKPTIIYTLSLSFP